jgi:hypothetical protein
MHTKVMNAQHMISYKNLPEWGTRVAGIISGADQTVMLI